MEEGNCCPSDGGSPAGAVARLPTDLANHVETTPQA
jgi:hypothetical protein